MRDSGPDELALDPVEQERRLIASRREYDLGTGQNSTPHEGVRWTFPHKLAVAVALALALTYLLLWARAVQSNGGPEGYVRITDFVATLTGASVIAAGDGPRLYDLPTQRAAQSRVRAPYLPALTGDAILPYNHLPFEALFIAPFMGLPYPVVFAIWTLIAGLAIGLALGIMDSTLPIARPGGWVMSLVACSYFALIRSLMLGQNSALVLLGLCGAYAALKKGYSGWAGAALLLVALKPQVLPVIALLLVLERQWKTLATFAGLFGGLSVASMVVLGPGWVVQYVGLLVGVAGWSDANAIDPGLMHNWRGLATNLLGGWEPALVGPVYALLSLASVALLVLTWWRSRGEAPSITQSEGSIYLPRYDLLWALTGIVAVLTSLHLNPHDLTLLIFPAWIVGAYALSGEWSKNLNRVWFPVLWVSYAIAPLTLFPPPALAVVPSVLLMAASALLLARLSGLKHQVLSTQT